MAQNDDIDLLELWRALLSHKWLLIALFVVSAGASIAAALLLPKVYEAKVVLAPTTADTSQGLLSALPGPLSSIVGASSLGLGSDGSSNEAIAVLRSNAFTSTFIEEYGLLDTLFEDDNLPADDPPTMGDALEKFDEDVRSIGVDSQTGLVTLSIAWTDRKLAADWANAMVQEINEGLRLLAIAEAEQSLVFLNAELQKTRVTELKSAIYRSIEAQINAIMNANVKKEFAFKVIDPAIVADEDKYVRPRRKLIVISSVMISMLFGVAFVLLRTMLRRE